LARIKPQRHARASVAAILALLILCSISAPLASLAHAQDEVTQGTLFFVAYRWPQTDGQYAREHIYRATDPAAPIDVAAMPTGAVPSISPDGKLAVVSSVSDQDISFEAFDALTGKQVGVLSVDHGLAGAGDGTLVATPARWLPDGSAFTTALSWRSDASAQITWLRVDRGLTESEVIDQVKGPASSTGMAGSGQWGTYNEDVGPGWHVRLVQHSTGRSMPLSVLPSQYTRDANWNSDESRLAYFEQGTGTAGKIWTTDWTLLTTAPDGADRQALHTFNNTRILPGGASWSPDGRLIAVAAPDLPETCCSLSELPGTIYVIDVASGAVKNVASFTTSSTARWSAPAWSPDGAQIAFLDAVPNLDALGPFDRLLAKVFVLNIKTGERTQVQLPADMQADNPIVWTTS
jgi:hypothetical protein